MLGTSLAASCATREISTQRVRAQKKPISSENSLEALEWHSTSLTVNCPSRPWPLKRGDLRRRRRLPGKHWKRTRPRKSRKAKPSPGSRWRNHFLHKVGPARPKRRLRAPSKLPRTASFHCSASRSTSLQPEFAPRCARSPRQRRGLRQQSPRRRNLASFASSSKRALLWARRK